MNKLNDLFSKFNINENNKKIIKGVFIIIIVILSIYFVITFSLKTYKNTKCNNLRKEILTLTDEYMINNNLLPNLLGEASTMNLNELDQTIVFKDYGVTGKVTYTKYNEEYIKTLELDNAPFCTTKKFKKKSDRYNKNKNVKVETYFNYYNVDSYNSKWTNWLPSKDINTEETDGVKLPLDSNRLPSIPDNAIITEYVRETKNKYKYRDKKWKFYKNNINYSDFSSEPLEGYPNKDSYTYKKSEQTNWSLNYPEEKEYRHIQSKTGYRYYKEENNKKIYWNDGEYLVEPPEDNNYKKDNKQSARMYSYYDDMWRWYNGNTKRMYSSYSSIMPKGYNYKDEELYNYGTWSSWDDNSKLNDTNRHYREEQIDEYSRYLIKYDINGYKALEKDAPLEDIEKTFNKSYEEVNNDPKIHLDIKFKFLYE